MNPGRHPIGVIWDVDPGSLQLLVYPDGLLGVPASLRNRVGFALRYVRCGAPVVFDPDHATATREERRIRDLTSAAQPRAIATQVYGAFFIATEQILLASLSYRVVYSALELTISGSRPRRFKWTPSVNPMAATRRILSAALGPRLVD